VEHAIGAEKRTPAKLEGDSVAAPLADPAGVKHWMVRRGGAGFACYIFLKVLEIHDLRSWLFACWCRPTVLVEKGLRVAGYCPA